MIQMFSIGLAKFQCLDTIVSQLDIPATSKRIGQLIRSANQIYNSNGKKGHTDYKIQRMPLKWRSAVVNKRINRKPF
jgi:hypothetical protein